MSEIGGALDNMQEQAGTTVPTSMGENAQVLTSAKCPAARVRRSTPRPPTHPDISPVRDLRQGFGRAAPALPSRESRCRPSRLRPTIVTRWAAVGRQGPLEPKWRPRRPGSRLGSTSLPLLHGGALRSRHARQRIESQGFSARCAPCTAHGHSGRGGLRLLLFEWGGGCVTRVHGPTPRGCLASRSCPPLSAPHNLRRASWPQTRTTIPEHVYERPLRAKCEG